jgi:DnaJ-class molecular chaperone
MTDQIDATPQACEHQFPSPEWCPLCQGALRVAAERECERLRAILRATLDPTDCEECFGEGEVLHLGVAGTLYETGACAACKGTGTWNLEDSRTC